MFEPLEPETSDMRLGRGLNSASFIVFALSIFLACAGIMSLRTPGKGGLADLRFICYAEVLMMCCLVGLVASWVLAVVGAMCSRSAWLLALETAFDLAIIVFVIWASS